MIIRQFVAWSAEIRWSIEANDALSRLDRRFVARAINNKKKGKIKDRLAGAKVSYRQTEGNVKFSCRPKELVITSCCWKHAVVVEVVVKASNDKKLEIRRAESYKLGCALTDANSAGLFQKLPGLTRRLGFQKLFSQTVLAGSFVRATPEWVSNSIPVLRIISQTVLREFRHK